MNLTDVRRKAPVAAAALVAATVLAGCGTSAAADGEEVTTIRYQSSTGMVSFTELAEALGYLDGLTLDWVGESGGGPASLQALATGQIDVAGGPFNGAIAKVASTGVPITAVVAGYGSSGEVNSSIVTLDDRGITNGRDLIGKKVAVNTLGANAEAVLDTYLTRAGLSADDIAKVTLVPLPGINTEAALRQGQVDAAYMGFASKETALAHGGLRILADDTDFVGPYNGGSYVLTNEFIDRNPATTRTLVAGLARAIEFSQTHTTAEVMDVYGTYLEEHGRGEEIAAYASWKGNGVATPGGVLRDEDFTLWLDWLESSGEVDTDSIDPGDLYTNEFNPIADRSGQ